MLQIFIYPQLHCFKVYIHSAMSNNSVELPRFEVTTGVVHVFPFQSSPACKPRLALRLVKA
jgi:hypothetical protein